MAVFEVGKAKAIKEGFQFDWADATETEKTHLQEVLRHKQDGFDLRTHIVDPKSGMLLKFQPYRRVCSGGDVFYYRKGEDGIERRYSESGGLMDADPSLAKQSISNQPEVTHGKRISR